MTRRAASTKEHSYIKRLREETGLFAVGPTYPCHVCISLNVNVIVALHRNEFIIYVITSSPTKYGGFFSIFVHAGDSVDFNVSGGTCELNAIN